MDKNFNSFGVTKPPALASQVVGSIPMFESGSRRYKMAYVKRHITQNKISLKNYSNVLKKITSKNWL